MISCREMLACINRFRRLYLPAFSNKLLISKAQQGLRVCLITCGLSVSLNASAIPGSILYSDDFERATLGAGWTVTDPTSSGISNQTANSATRSMFTGEKALSLTTTNIDLSGLPSAELSLWVQRGEDSFSEDPDGNEDLTVEYKNSSGAFVVVAAFSGAGTPGEEFDFNFILPADALHSGFQIKISQSSGSGNNFDFWHIDDIVITETSFVVFGPDFCDDFERPNLGADWLVTSANAGISAQTANSPTRSMFSRSEAQSMTSRLINLGSTTQADLSMWVQRGSDTFSENPDFGEDLVIEYRNVSGGFTVLQTLSGNGTPGEEYNLLFTLPSDGLHSDFQIRFRQVAASTGNFDYWHMDDVCIVDSIALDPEIETVLTSGAPSAAPSEIVTYTISVTNVGQGQAANVVVDGLVPLFADLGLDSYGSGVAFNFVENTSMLAIATEDFSVDGGSNFGYLPVSGSGGAAVGFEGLVTDFRISTFGIMPPGGSFTIEYKVQVH